MSLTQQNEELLVGAVQIYARMRGKRQALLSAIFQGRYGFAAKLYKTIEAWATNEVSELVTEDVTMRREWTGSCE